MSPKVRIWTLSRGVGHLDLLLGKLDGSRVAGCAEIEGAAASAPGVANVCHLPLLSGGSHPSDTHTDLSSLQVGQLPHNIYLVPTKYGSHPTKAVAIVRI